MTALIIIGIIILFFGAVLFVPIGADLRFKDEFAANIKFCGITVYKFNTANQNMKEGQEKTSAVKKEEKRENDPKSFFERLKGKYGFAGAVKELFSFAKNLLTHIKPFLRHIKIKRIILNLTVAAEDAAATAIEYGAVCAATYPVLAMLSAVGEIKYKSVNISSDFTSAKASFDFSLSIRTSCIYLLILAFKAYQEYQKFTERQDNNERK